MAERGDRAEESVVWRVLAQVDRCAACQRAFGPGDVAVVARGPAMWLLRLACPACGAREFAAAVAKEGDAGRASVALRHLRAGGAPEDAPGLAASPSEGGGAVTAGDVRAVRAFLAAFDGDFRRLFGRG